MSIRNNTHLLTVAALILVVLSLPSCGLLSPQSGRQLVDLSGEQILLVGTYTDDGSSEGIYSFSYKGDKGEMRHRGTFITPNPTSMTIDQGRGVVYIANRITEEAMVSATQLDAISGRLSALNSSYTLGCEPSSIVTDGEGKVVTTNHMSGSITLFQTDKRGLLGQPDWHIVLGEEGVSLPSSAIFTPDGKELFVVDQGQEKIFHFNVSSTNPPLTIDVEGTELPKGASPLTLTFDAHGERAYLLTERSPTIYVYAHEGGKLQLIQRVLLPGGEGQVGRHIALSPDGRYLYASVHGGSDRLLIYSVDRSNGHLSPAGERRVGSDPRHFALHPNGTLVAVACHESDRIEFYSRDSHNGQLRLIQDLSIAVSHPAFLMWVERK